MIEQHPLFIDYWEDKKAMLRNITVPMYATASYSTGLHTEGSVRGFLLSRSTEKWQVKVASTQKPTSANAMAAGYAGPRPKNGMTSTSQRT
jgi:predicted acyl esterase